MKKRKPPAAHPPTTPTDAPKVTGRPERVWTVAARRDPLSRAPWRDAWAYVEAARWFDARAFGARLLGAAGVFIASPGAYEITWPRWQLRWVGSSAGTGARTLRMQARRVLRGGHDPSWRDADAP